MPRSCKNVLVHELLCGRTVPYRLERRVVALPNESDRKCATTRVVTLETPKECLSFVNHAIIDVDASRAKSTHWRNSRLSRHVLLACQVQGLICQERRLQELRPECPLLCKGASNLIQQGAECSHEVGYIFSNPMFPYRGCPRHHRR